MVLCPASWLFGRWLVKRNVKNLQIPKMVMADVYNLRVTINPQLLKAQATKETTLFSRVTAQAVRQQCPSRSL